MGRIGHALQLAAVALNGQDCLPELPPDVDGRTLYLDLLKRSLINWIYGPEDAALAARPLLSHARRWLSSNPAARLQPRTFSPARRIAGLDWPPIAHTMVGWNRLGQLQSCLEDIFRRNVAGDVLEAGVWRGGACVFLRGIMRAYGVTDRTVWLADSFRGLPEPRDPEDAGQRFHQWAELAIPRAAVEEAFRRYGLLDCQVRFLEGWFADTLPSAPIASLALLRIDGDLYRSTMDVLEALYPRVSVGGYVIVDDYHSVSACQEAVDAYRSAHGVTAPLRFFDQDSAYWIKDAGDA
jgi:hypothetical protein